MAMPARRTKQDMLLALLAEDQPLHLAGLGEPATSLIDRMPRVCVRLMDAHTSFRWVSCRPMC